MKKKITIIALLTLFAPLSVAEEPVIKIDLRYDNGGVSLQGHSVTQGYVPPKKSGAGDYTVRVINRTETLYSTQFNIQTEIFVDGPEFGGSRKLNETAKRLIIPFQEGSETIQIYHDRKKIIQENISTKNLPSNISEKNKENKVRETEEEKDRDGKIPLKIIAAVLMVLLVIAFLSIEAD